MVLMHNVGRVMFNRNNFIDLENGEYVGTPLTFVFGQIFKVLEERDSKLILGLITYNIVIVYYLCSWVTSTNSIALRAYANTIYFNVFALLVCLISIWVEINGPANRNFCKGPRRTTISGSSRLPNIFSRICTKHSRNEKIANGKWQRNDTSVSNYEYNDGSWHENSRDKIYDAKSSIDSLGLEKYEVLALLVSSCFSLIAGSLISLEVVARLNNQPNVHTGRLGLGALLGFLAHLGTIIGYPDAGLNHVVCKALPCPTLRGCNPILGGNMISALIITGTHLVIHFWEIHMIDTAAAFAVLGLIAMSMLPIAFYTSNIIFQKLPRHMSEQLNECLREALIIDGVLEFRNERFWTKSFGKLAGTLQVRVRSNANESDVIESVMRRLSRIVTTLTIQKFRETQENDVTNFRPIEDYVDEILSSRDGNIDENLEKNSDSRQRMNEDSGIIRMEDIIGSEDRIETFANWEQLGRHKNSFIDVKIVDKSIRPLTIYKNDNVIVTDRLWRGDLTKKNALLFGTKIELERFDNFFVASRNCN